MAETPTPDRPPTARERARASVIADITAQARRQLAEVGPAALSVRAVARALDMPSSGIYRYVASRDELLTLLIVDAYESLADRVEAVATASAGNTPVARRARLVAAAGAVWDWAEEHPHEYGLLYGTPVPGYAAPDATIAPVERLSAALLEPLDGELEATFPEPRDGLGHDLVGIGERFGGLAASTVLAALDLWATIFGAVSLHRFGHTTGVVGDGREWFLQTMELEADRLGLAPRELGAGPRRLSGRDRVGRERPRT